MQAQTFLERHTPHLTEIANAASPELQGNADTRKFLTQIHAGFETVVDKPGKRPSLPGEDVFWWSVTILEELSELSHGSAPTSNPYTVMMLDQLRSMATRLVNAEPLPPEFQIHWFDDVDTEDETD